MRRIQPTRTLVTLALTTILAPACKVGPAGADGTNGANGFNALVSTTSLSPGDSHCPNGGTQIDSGLDNGAGGGTAGDGVLQSGEITSTSYVCNPGTALVKSTAVPYGDPNCPGGGTRIDTGLDDGSGGGTAGDGILQPGEVTSTTYDCNDVTQEHVGSFDPPSGAEGTYSIRTGGGSATAAGSNGGGGGHVEVDMADGSAGGHVKLFKTGQVDASFTFPALPANFDYGTTSLVVSSTTEVKPVTSLTSGTDVDNVSLHDGDIVAIACSEDSLYVWHSTDSSDRIDGVHVMGGGTLTFDHEGGAGCIGREVDVDHAFVNEGTITTGQDTNGNADWLTLWVGSFYGAPGSKLDLRGADGTPGGNGGALEIYANLASADWGALWNQGTIDTSGGDGDNDGGRAGYMVLVASGSLYNTGDLLARGGNAATLDYSSAHTYGGEGYPIEITSGVGGLYNSGLVDASGGKGSVGGNTAGYVQLTAGDNGAGDLYNTGKLVAAGGDADASCTDSAACYGGEAWGVFLYANGDIHNSGDLISRGGAGAAGAGGDAYGVYVQAQTGTDPNVDGNTVPGGAIWMSGNVDTRGGDGANGGGWGGDVQFLGEPTGVPLGQEITFLGYGGGFDTQGGDGVQTGGDAGYTEFYQDGCAANASTCAWPAGSVINYVDVTSTGGSASTGDGGDGGYALWTTVEDSYAVGSFGYEKLINHGSVDTSGGQGGANGGNSGYISFYGLDGLDNEGVLTANGGGATAAGGVAGDADTYSATGAAYAIALLADRGPVVNTRDLSGAGGASTASSGDGVGGQGGGVHLEGPTVKNAGSLSGNGGDSNTTAGSGGDGANVVLQSVQGTTDNSGALTAAGGAGASGQTGTDAKVVIDGQIVP